MESTTDKTVWDVLGRLAPGTKLRQGLDRILESGRGGLIVISDSDAVQSICSGGFLVDSPFSPQKLAELSKMDCAIILDAAVTKIARANVHLLPDPKVSTSETGTRHRTAERVARSLAVPVVAVSESRNDIHIYAGDQVRPLVSVSRLLEKSNQAIATLQRYRSRLDVVSRSLSLLEVEGKVSRRDVIEVIQRAEMVARLASEIRQNLVELGTQGRQIRFQLEDLMAGVTDDRRLLLRDYIAVGVLDLNEAMSRLTGLVEDDLFDEDHLAESVGIGAGIEASDILRPKGYRLLSKLPLSDEHMVQRLVERYGFLGDILRARSEDLEAIEGVGPERAAALKEGAMRLVEDSFFDLK